MQISLCIPTPTGVCEVGVTSRATFIVAPPCLLGYPAKTLACSRSSTTRAQGTRYDGATILRILQLEFDCLTEFVSSCFRHIELIPMACAATRSTTSVRSMFAHRPDAVCAVTTDAFGIASGGQITVRIILAIFPVMVGKFLPPPTQHDCVFAWRMPSPHMNLLVCPIMGLDSWVHSCLLPLNFIFPPQRMQRPYLLLLCLQFSQIRCRYL
jgi:hypothetical protein